MSRSGSAASDLPVPVDDGACDHLADLALPAIELGTTSGRTINPAELSGWVVIYCYPRTGEPGKAPPEGWAQIPGAMGCTPEACAFRDHHAEMKALGAEVFGLSTQTTDYQQEAVGRLELSFELLSDASFTFTEALNLPTFEAAGMRLIKRLTLIAKDGKIVKVFYPVFPPDQHAAEVVDWLKENTG